MQTHLTEFTYAHVNVDLKMRDYRNLNKIPPGNRVSYNILPWRTNKVHRQPTAEVHTHVHVSSQFRFACGVSKE